MLRELFNSLISKVNKKKPAQAKFEEHAGLKDTIIVSKTGKTKKPKPAKITSKKKKSA